MKRAARVLLVAALLCSAFALTGCVNFSYKFDVKNDGSGTMKFAYTIDKDVADSLGESGSTSPEDMLDDDARKEAERLDLTPSVIDTESEIGIALEGEFSKPEELADTFASVNDFFAATSGTEESGDVYSGWKSDGDLVLKRGLFSTEYTLTLSSSLDLGSAADTSSDDQAAATAALLGDSLKYSVEAVMPGKIVESNGEFEKGGNTVTWEAGLVSAEPESLTVVSRKSNILGVLLIVGLVGFAVIVGAIILVVVLRKKSSSVSATPVADYKFCEKCGTQMKREDRFCPSCGYSGADTQQ